MHLSLGDSPRSEIPRLAELVCERWLDPVAHGDSTPIGFRPGRTPGGVTTRPGGFGGAAGRPAAPLSSTDAVAEASSGRREGRE
jgi:hypothetical protein